MGRVLVQDLGETARGLELLEQAVRAAPDDPDAHQNRAWVLTGLCQFEAGIAEHRERVRVQPNDTEAHSDLSWALLSNGDFAAALEVARESLRLDPLDGWANVAVQEALFAAGDVEGAERAIELAFSRKVGAWATSVLVAKIAALRGDSEGARRSLAHAVEQTGSRINWRVDLAIEIARFPDPKARDLDAILAIAREAVELLPKAWTAREALGAVRFAMGDWQGCVDELRRAIDLSGGGIPFHWIYLAMAQERLGRHADAVQWYQKTTDWMAARRCRNAELLRTCAEAKKLIEVDQR